MWYVLGAIALLVSFTLIGIRLRAGRISKRTLLELEVPYNALSWKEEALERAQKHLREQMNESVRDVQNIKRALLQLLSVQEEYNEVWNEYADSRHAAEKALESMRILQNMTGGAKDMGAIGYYKNAHKLSKMIHQSKVMPDQNLIMDAKLFLMQNGMKMEELNVPKIKKIALSPEEKQRQEERQQQIQGTQERLRQERQEAVSAIQKKYKRLACIFLPAWVAITIFLYVISRKGMPLESVGTILGSDQNSIILAVLLGVFGLLAIGFVLQIKKRSELKQQREEYYFLAYLYVIGMNLAIVGAGIFGLWSSGQLPRILALAGIGTRVESQQFQTEERDLEKNQSENIAEDAAAAPAENADTTPSAVIVTAENLNVRKTPGTDGELLQKLPGGTVCKATGRKNEDGSWIEILLPDNGQAGWASAQYLEDVSAADESSDQNANSAQTGEGGAASGYSDRFKAARQELERLENSGEMQELMNQMDNMIN